MKTRLIVLAMLALLAVGFIFLRGPIPHIAIAAEPLTSVGGVKITNTMITSWVVVVLILLGILFITSRKWTIVPGGVQNFVEAVVEAFYNLVTGIAGEENGRKFFPVVATIFFFVLINNWLSLTPVFNQIGFFGHNTPVEEQLEEHGYVHGIIFDEAKVGPFDLHLVPFSGPDNLAISDDSRTIKEGAPDSHDKYDEAIAEGKPVGELIPLFRGPNTDLNTPLAIAIWSAIFVEFWGVAALGFFKYGGKFIRFSSPIDFFVGILELISEMVRLVSFTFRLFGNMFAGEVVILMFTFLTPLIITLPFYGLELFVGVIQAFIFASLTLVFAVMAVQSHDDHEEHAKEHRGADTDRIQEAITEPSHP
jgi:F-type H+-transporting ATPase subunit a